MSAMTIDAILSSNPSDQTVPPSRPNGKARRAARKAKASLVPVAEAPKPKAKAPKAPATPKQSKAEAQEAAAAQRQADRAAKAERREAEKAERATLVEQAHAEVQRRIAEETARRSCLCGCGTGTKAFFVPGHDAKLVAGIVATSSLKATGKDAPAGLAQ